MLRFAILKSIGDGKEVTVLEYREDQFIERLQARVEENLIKLDKPRNKYKKDIIKKSIQHSWDELIKEFKELTVNIK